MKVPVSVPPYHTCNYLIIYLIRAILVVFHFSGLDCFSLITNNVSIFSHACSSFEYIRRNGIHILWTCLNCVFCFLKVFVSKNSLCILDTCLLPDV